MANDDLDGFLTQGASELPAPAPADPVVEAAAAQQPEETPKPAAASEPDDDTDPPEPVEGEELVPRRAFEAIRHQRHDWKAKAIEAETKRAELERQLNEAKAAAAAPPSQQYAPPPVQQQPLPDFNTDPQGYMEAYKAQMQEDMLHARANISEMHLRNKLGPDKVAELKAEFKAAAEVDPTLYQKLRSQLDPYGWLAVEMERTRLLREVGDDPSAYKARLRAELEAELATTQQQQAPAPRQVSPAAGMAPSLASARSVAGRSAQAYTGPTSLDALFGR